MSAEQEKAETKVKWAQFLLHRAEAPDPVSQHCAIRASEVEAAARHLASVESENETLHARVAEIDAAALAACPENSTLCLDEPDPDVGRYLICNENGDPLVDTSNAAEVVSGLHALWLRVSMAAEERAQENETLRARVAEVERERDDERRAHEEIASVCFQHGAEASDGTSLSAVRSLEALLVEAQREQENLRIRMYQKHECMEDAERRLAAVTTLVATMEQLASQAYEHWDNDRDAKVGKILGALASYRPGYSLPLDAARQAVTDAEAAAQRGVLKVDGGEEVPFGAITPKHTVKTLHDDAMASCDAGNFAFAAVLEASALERAVSLRVSPATICILADGLTEIVKRIRHHAARDPIQIPRDFPPSLEVKT